VKDKNTLRINDVHLRESPWIEGLFANTRRVVQEQTYSFGQYKSSRRKNVPSGLWLVLYFNI